MRRLLFLASLCSASPAWALPPCGPAMDGQVSESGCTCRHQQASQLSAEPAGWRWTCDLLRGSAAPPVPADLPSSRSNERPAGTIYVQPQPGNSHGY